MKLIRFQKVWTFLKVGIWQVYFRKVVKTTLLESEERVRILLESGDSILFLESEDILCEKVLSSLSL